MPHAEVQNLFVPSIEEAVIASVARVCLIGELIKTQVRNNLIKQRYAAGETLADLGKAFNLSYQRIHQILNDTY